MNSFRLGETDFGINPGKSACSIDTADGGLVVNLEIRGDDEKYDAITENEDSEWSWTQYPPRLYIHDFPLTNDGDIKRAKISRDDLDEYEAAIYLMEHNDVDGVELSVDPDGVLQIRGNVLLSGQPHIFTVHYTDVKMNA